MSFSARNLCDFCILRVTVRSVPTHVATALCAQPLLGCTADARHLCSGVCWLLVVRGGLPRLHAEAWCALLAGYSLEGRSRTFWFQLGREACHRPSHSDGRSPAPNTKLVSLTASLSHCKFTGCNILQKQRRYLHDASIPAPPRGFETCKGWTWTWTWTWTWRRTPR